MRKLALGLLAAFSVVACGCGGGGGGSEPVAVSLTAERAPLVIAAFGDSTQAGWTLVSSEVGYIRAPAPAAEAQRQLRAWTGRDDIEVVNEGYGGNTTQKLLDGMDGSGKPWPDRMRDTRASIVTVNNGINDWLLTPAEHRAKLREVIQIARAAGKTVMLETPNPILPGTPTSAPFDIPALSARVQLIRDVAVETSTPLCDHFQKITDQGLATMEYLPDGVHPSAALYAFKGRTLGACLLHLL